MFNRETKTSFYKENFPTLDPVIEVANRVKVLVFKERTEDLNKGLSYNDFSLQSLLDADAIDLLLPVAPIQRDNLSAADVANVVASNIGNIADSVTSVEPKTESDSFKSIIKLKNNE